MWNGPLVEEPMTIEERDKVASKCVEEMGLDMIPAVIDRLDNAVNAAYAAHPDRLYLVGIDGKLRYVGGRGPFGFKPQELEVAIIEELSILDEARAPKKRR